MRMSRKRLLACGIPLAALAAAVLATGAATGALSWVSAVQLAALGVIGSSLAVLAVVVRRLYLNVNRLRISFEAHSLDVTAAVDADRARMLRKLDSAEKSLTSLRRLRESEVPELKNEMRKSFTALRKHVTTQGRFDYAQLVAWQELREFAEPGPFMPPLRGWAASPDVLLEITARLCERPPKLVVECGSGASSVWLGYMLRKLGAGHVVALDHEERFAGMSRDLVTSHGLEDTVEIRYAPLRDWTGAMGDDGGVEKQYQWYDLDAVADLTDIDFLFIDGPSQATGPQARYPAGPVLLPRCVPGAVVVLDDAKRDDELAAGDRWLADDSDLERTEIPTEKGTHVFTWRTP